MNSATGYFKKKVKSYSWKIFVEACNIVQAEGYTLYKSSYKTQWPFFWIRKYKAKFRKAFVYGDGVFAEYNKNEIDSLIERGE